MSLNSRQLRRLDDNQAADLTKEVKRFPIYLILENILDTYNIGGFFRLADAVAATKIYLCGQTGTPPDPKITKASVGAYKLVPWEYKPTVAAAVADLRGLKNLQILAVEQHPGSVDYKKRKYRFPLAFIFGNETTGTSEEALKLAEAIIELPMYGVNKSLNVMIAAGITLYWALEKSKVKKLLKIWKNG